MRRTAASWSALVVVSAAIGGCGAFSGSGTSAGSSGTPSVGRSASVTGTIIVFAAASLRDAFTTLGSRFEAANPGTEVVFSFGPSSGLAEQIGQGAPADVFASGSITTMDQVVSGGDAANPTNLVTNRMAIAVPLENPARIGSLADLGRPGVKVALCQAQVPCGATAQRVLANAEVEVTPVTEEVDVKATLSKVLLGEVDAGVVYVTDVQAATDLVKGIEIPDDVNASTTYPVATLTGSTNGATARAYVDFVRSPDGLAVLTEAGFARP